MKIAPPETQRLLVLKALIVPAASRAVVSRRSILFRDGPHVIQWDPWDLEHKHRLVALSYFDGIRVTT